MTRQQTHWVQVADSGQARILELQRKPFQCKLVSEVESEARHTPSRDLVSDGSGRSFHVQGPGSHSKEPRANPHEQAEEAFVQTLSRALDKACQIGSFDQLDVIADARTIGRLRRAMSRQVAARLGGEHRLNLSNLPFNDLQNRVRRVLGWVH